MKIIPKKQILVPIMMCLSSAALTSAVKAAQSMVNLTASRQIILADGKQQTQIYANVRDQRGEPLNGVSVVFQTTAGIITRPAVTTINGIAQTSLISSPIAGIAHVTAIAEGAGQGASNILDIEFTNDAEDTYTGNNYVQVSGKYLAYSATDHIITADSLHGSSQISYRNFDLKADQIQLKADDNAVLRATDNITLRLGSHTVKAVRLYYSMSTETGYAVAWWNGKLQQVQISGIDLKLQKPYGIVPPSYFTIPSVQVKMVVVAKSIAYFPGDKLQFKQPRFYQDNLQILSLPYYEMSLSSNQLFSDHFVSVGSHGFGLELPFYYNLTPRSSGILYLRHEQQLGRGYFSTDPGWSMDLLQSYSSAGSQRYQGSYGFTGFLHGDWGFNWTHSQQFNDSSQGNFYVDFPHHTGVVSSINLSKQLKQGSVGLDLNGGQTFVGASQTSLQGDAYMETSPHPFVHGLSYVLGTRFSSGYSRMAGSLIPVNNASSEELTFRTFTRPFILDKRTTLISSLTLGHVWSSSQFTGNTGLATVSLDRTLSRGDSINLTYDYMSSPTTVLDLGGKNRISLTYQLNPSKRLQVSMFGSSFLDGPSASFLADAAYRINNDWRLMMSTTLQNDAYGSYKDVEFTIGRRVGARELQLTYSTYSKRIYFDFTSTHW